jgi:hypothetical protein
VKRARRHGGTRRAAWRRFAYTSVVSGRKGDFTAPVALGKAKWLNAVRVEMHWLEPTKFDPKRVCNAKRCFEEMGESPTRSRGNRPSSTLIWQIHESQKLLGFRGTAPGQAQVRPISPLRVDYRRAPPLLHTPLTRSPKRMDALTTNCEGIPGIHSLWH